MLCIDRSCLTFTRRCLELQHKEMEGQWQGQWTAFQLLALQPGSISSRQHIGIDSSFEWQHWFDWTVITPRPNMPNVIKLKACLMSSARETCYCMCMTGHSGKWAAELRGCREMSPGWVCGVSDDDSHKVWEHAYFTITLAAGNGGSEDLNISYLGDLNVSCKSNQSYEMRNMHRQNNSVMLIMS